MTEKIKREECHIGIYPFCIEFENGKVVRNCYACIEKYGYAKGVYAENQKNKKAWEEVLKELEEKKDVYKLVPISSTAMGKAYTYDESTICMAIDIIKQKLAEIEERN